MALGKGALYALAIVTYIGLVSGVVYDFIVQPPSRGTTTDKVGRLQVVPFRTGQLHGQYITEGLGAGAMVLLSALGLILLERTDSAGYSSRRLRYIVVAAAALCALAQLVSFFFFKTKFP